MIIKMQIVKNLAGVLRQCAQALEEETYQRLCEIRVRVDKPVLFKIGQDDYFYHMQKGLTKETAGIVLAAAKDLKETMELLGRYSLYAFQEELRRGYITIEGGHRVGVTGETVCENGRVKTIKHINGLNIRISREIRGCGSSVLPYVIVDGQAVNTMILSPPGYGKTTLLRDMICQLSNGQDGIFHGFTVGVSDERGEIASCYLGRPQKEVGLRTDVLDACPKLLGMQMLLRSMSPEIIAVDEIGAKEDICAIEEVVNSGAAVLCTVHAKALQDLQLRPILNELINRRIFKRFILLRADRRQGEIAGIYNEDFKLLSGKKEEGK